MKRRRLLNRPPLKTRIDIAAIYKTHTELAILLNAGNTVAWVPFSLVILRGTNNRPVKSFEPDMVLIANMAEDLAREKGFL